jgi:hypothetical protein
MCGLANTGFSFLNRTLLAAFVDWWHEETNSFHIPGGEIIVTLDDVYYVLHIPIKGIRLDHQGIIISKH